MKKTILILAVFVAVLFLVSACNPTTKVSTPTAEPEKETIVSGPAEPEEVPEPVVHEPEEKEEKASKGLSTGVQELLTLNSRVKSISYDFQDDDLRPIFHEFFVKGSKVAVEIPRDTISNPDYRYTTIYLDLNDKSAEAYCTDDDLFFCPDPNKMFDVKFSDFYKKTPFDWLATLEQADDAEIVAEETIDRRKAQKVIAHDGSVTTTYWIDDYYGMPLQIIVEGGSEEGTYYFTTMAFNKVQDSDVTR